jgi:hypothetical protein
MERSLLVGVDHVFFEPFDPFDVIDRVTVLDVHWSLVYELEVFGHLPRQFFQHFFGQSCSVVAELAELDKLHQISFGLVALGVHHLAVVIIQFVHNRELSFTYAHYDH